MNYSGEVRDFVVANFLFGDAAGLRDDASFLDTGIVDSTGILELISFLEETCHVKFDDSELVADNLDTVIRIAAFVAGKAS